MKGIGSRIVPGGVRFHSEFRLAEGRAERIEVRGRTPQVMWSVRRASASSADAAEGMKP